MPLIVTGSSIRASRGPTAGFALSIPVALISPTAAQLVWFIPFIGTRAFRIREQRREDEAEVS